MIRPVDFQHLFAKSNIVEKFQQLTQQLPEIFQKYKLAENAKKAELKREKVEKSKSKDEAKTKKEGRNINLTV